MNITLSNTDELSKEELTISYIENPDFVKTVKIEDLPEEERLLIYGFCQENPNETISIPQAYPLNISIKLVDLSISQEPKEITDILNKTRIQKTGMLLDLVTNLISNID